MEEDTKITEVDVQLKHSFKYQANRASGGGTEPADAKFIRLIAFNMKQMDKALPVKEIAMKAMINTAKGSGLSAEDLQEAKDTAESESTKMDAESMMAAISMFCGDGDLVKLHAHLIKLMTCGVAIIDGDGAPLNGSFINDMHPDDFTTLCGEYIGNFII